MCRRRAAALLFAAPFFATACSSLLDADFDRASTDAEDAASITGTADTATGADASSTSGLVAEPVDGAVDTSGVTREAEVLFSAASGGSETVAMAFFDAPSSGATTASTQPCTSLGTTGPCVVTNCPSGNALGGQSLPTLVSAGTVTVSGGSTMLQYVPLSGNRYSYVGAASDASKLLQPGTTVEISAQGSADFPAFTSYFTLVGGGDFTIYSGVTNGAIARSDALMFGSSAGGTLTVTASAVATVGEDAGTGHTVATCTFGKNGSGTLAIPAAVWSYFPPGADVELTAGAESKSVLRVGDALITLDASGAVYFPASGRSGLTLGLQ